LVEESKVDDAGPSDPKIAQEISRLTSYYNSGQPLSKMRSGKRFKENSDSDEEGTNDTGGFYDVAALIVDRMKLPNGTVKWIEKQEFAMNAVHIKKYETMEQDKIPLSVYRDVFRAPMTLTMHGTIRTNGNVGRGEKRLQKSL
jgi:hypothetical protein